MQKHSAYRLTYALNETGQLVEIDDVPVGNKCGCFCPACKEPLIAKNQGVKRMHHFAHQSGTECDYAVESMLHILAKEKIRRAFLSKSEFWIEFEYKSFCARYEECKYCRYSECYKSERRSFNIKSYYDSCEQEIPYDNVNRRSDLKIFSSTKPERKPIYLELFVTHESSLEKLHSGNRIIEICIESEDDILQLVKNGIIESDNYNGNDYKGLERKVRKIVFYGFKQSDYDNDHISNKIDFVRYILYKSGKTQCFQDACDCKRIVKSKSSSLLEICVHTSVAFGLYEQIKYFGYQRFKIPNCVLCKNYVDSYSDIKICRLYKHLQIPRYGKFDTARARTCRYFEIDQEEMLSALKNGLKEYYTIFCDKQSMDDMFSLHHVPCSSND